MTKNNDVRYTNFVCPKCFKYYLIVSDGYYACKCGFSAPINPQQQPYYFGNMYRLHYTSSFDNGNYYHDFNDMAFEDSRIIYDPRTGEFTAKWKGKLNHEGFIEDDEEDE